MSIDFHPVHGYLLAVNDNAQVNVWEDLLSTTTTVANVGDNAVTSSRKKQKSKKSKQPDCIITVESTGAKQLANQQVLCATFLRNSDEILVCFGIQARPKFTNISYMDSSSRAFLSAVSISSSTNSASDKNHKSETLMVYGFSYLFF